MSQTSHTSAISEEVKGGLALNSSLLNETVVPFRLAGLVIERRVTTNIVAGVFAMSDF